MQGLKDLYLSNLFNVPKLLTHLRLELINLPFEIGGEGPTQAMLDLLPWVLTGVPLQGGDTQLREAWITSCW